jgi:putative nucleotidyltransferase with HDIG domain
VLERAALLHDIGKIGVPEALLLKPSALSPEDYERVKEHSEAGARILETVPFLADVVPIVRHHHERWDGSGYPAGLAGEDIPFLARVLAVADSFDAMVSERPYRGPLPRRLAIDEVVLCSGSQFDPAVVDAFVAWAETTDN